MSDSLTLNITEAGAIPTPPSSILATLTAFVTAIDPGYTANLPGSLIEDISSTDVAAITQCDSLVIDLINSMSPYAANPFILNLLGQQAGVQQNQATNTSVFQVFSGTAGLLIAQGFTVSDGTYQYIALTGGIIGSGGVSSPIFFVALLAGTWAVPPNTVTQLITPPPIGVSLTTTNPLAGTPGGAAETPEAYRYRVLQAGLASAQGTVRLLKTLLAEVVGVQQRLISVVSSNAGFEVLCGGGDSYEVAYAIFCALPDVNNLVPSVLALTAVTQANPGVVSLDLNHGYATGQVVNFAGVGGMTELNSGTYTITVISETMFSIGVNTTGFTPYTTGGAVFPNFRNVSAAIYDAPNTYIVPYVSPPQQIVTIVGTWNTSSVSYVSDAAVQQLATPAIISYINGIVVGQPINLLLLNAAFSNSIDNIIAPTQLTRLVWAISINGVSTAPVSGTEIVLGDPESYFYTDPGGTGITITQG